MSSSWLNTVCFWFEWAIVIYLILDAGLFMLNLILGRVKRNDVAYEGIAIIAIFTFLLGVLQFVRVST